MQAWVGFSLGLFFESEEREKMKNLRKKKKEKKKEKNHQDLLFVLNPRLFVLVEVFLLEWHLVYFELRQRGEHQKVQLMV